MYDNYMHPTEIIMQINAFTRLISCLEGIKEEPAALLKVFFSPRSLEIICFTFKYFYSFFILLVFYRLIMSEFSLIIILSAFNFMTFLLNWKLIYFFVELISISSLYFISVIKDVIAYVFIQS